MDDLKELKKLGNDSDPFFKNVFKKLCLEEDLTDKEKEYLLTCALLFFKNYNQDKRLKGFFKIGFYIILKYAIKNNDYKPLYDISLQIGFYPIIDFITHQKRHLYKVDNKNRILDALAYISFKKKFLSPDQYIESLEQNISRNLIIGSTSTEIAYIAPTSYGKSSLIKEFIKTSNYSRIAIIVPSKSLLVQTYKDIKALKLNYKLVLHDEMYNNEDKFIGILTQERATRILNKNLKANYEVLFVDEAHKLLDRDSRSYILTRLIQLNFKRNYNQKIVYLSPLVEKENNLRVKQTKQGEIFTRRIQHDFKSFELYLFDNNKSYFYDKFTDTEFNLNKDTDYFSYIVNNSNIKNFIFHSRPIKVEKLAENISKKISYDLSENKNIEKIIQTLQKEVHKSFYVIDYIKKGVIYIHAKIPNIIKEYLEQKFKEVAEIKYIVANSVILEGVNLPIDTIFITTNGTGNKNEHLKVKDLINLVGRANRLNEVFSKDKKDLAGLISKIHFLNHIDFQGKYSIKTSVKSLREYSFKDIIKNPLIENYDIDKLEFSGTKEEKDKRKEKHKIEDESLIQFSEFVLESPKNQKEKVKKYLIENSIDMFFKDLEAATELIIKNMSNYQFNKEHKIVNIVNEIFINDNELNIKDYELERLKNESARKFYNNFLEITQKQHLNERINSTIDYFKIKAKTEDPYLYIGTSYGEEPRQSKKVYENKHYESKVYIDLRKAENILANIAIAKLKIEEDFVSFKLNSLIAFLHEFEIITEEYYYLYIYGTVNTKIIRLARFGLSVNIITKLDIDNQIINLDFDRNGNLFVTNQNNFDLYLINQPELFQFEVKKYLN
ncbi:DEAD/DEAH box helicase [Flavobacterium chilense]|uniref:DEAD/DEAH box helicase n=1 Tax=Flavobacterium chilense TaxID=946677 RepID=A0A1M7ISU6_9FLAO|nr:DEAD/DEAH box helicase [Flavobacterium chilense]SHM43866.1 DEAD/DEAH box helicase [Flavobacterium chilense]